MTIVPALDRFLEAASVVAKWRALNAIETHLERAMTRAFRAQGRTFLRKSLVLRSKFQESATRSDWLEVFDEASGETRQLFMDPIQTAAAAAMTAGATDVIAEVAIDTSFSLRNPRAVSYLQSRGFGLISQIDATTRGNIATIVGNGVAEGWSYNRVADEINDLYSQFAIGKPQQHIQSRAHLIAVTEAGNAYEQGSASMVQEMQDEGLRMEKSWLSVGDSRVSDGCRENEDEGWIPLAQAFPSGHMQPLRFPGCRCSAQYRRTRA